METIAFNDSMKEHIIFLVVVPNGMGKRHQWFHKVAISTTISKYWGLRLISSWETKHPHICCMNFVTMHNFRQSHKIVAKMTENCEATENFDSNITKLCRYAKKVAWIFLISWLCTIFRFSIIFWCFCHKIVSSNVQVLFLVRRTDFFHLWD